MQTAKAVAPPPQPMIIPKPKPQTVLNNAVLESVADLPRNHLGDVPYQVDLKPARLQDPRTGRPPRYGYKSTPVPLPMELIKDRLNCTLTVKVGKEHLLPAPREEITSRRAVWGTDIYTDDSDVVAACIHQGWIRGEWPEEVDVDMLDLYAVDEKDKKGRRSGPKTAPQTNKLVVLDAPPKGGPQNIPENRDLHVTLLVLPALEKYSSSVRFGIKSREWGGQVDDAEGLPHRSKHEGLSFMITGLRWVNNGAGTQNRLRGKARRERIRRALREVELGPLLAARSLNIDVGKAAEVVERVATPIDGDVQMTGNWWKHRGTPPSEGDKENAPAAIGAAERAEAVPEPVRETDGTSKDTDQTESASKEATSDEASGSKEVDADVTMEDITAPEDKSSDDKTVEDKSSDDKTVDDKVEEEPQAERANNEKDAETHEETVMEAAAQAIMQAAKEDSEKADSPRVGTFAAAGDPAQAPVTEPAKEAAQEPAQELPQEAVQEPAAEGAKEPVGEPAT